MPGSGPCASRTKPPTRIGTLGKPHGSSTNHVKPRRGSCCVALFCRLPRHPPRAWASAPEPSSVCAAARCLLPLSMGRSTALGTSLPLLHQESASPRLSTSWGERLLAQEAPCFATVSVCRFRISSVREEAQEHPSVRKEDRRSAATPS